MRSVKKKLLFGSLSAAVAVSGMAALAPSPASAASSGLVINEVYGGGGSTSGTPFSKADFVELFNPTGTPQSTAGLSLQYRSASFSGGNPSVLALNNATVPPGGHFLVQVSAGSNGPDLPVTPDQTGTALAMGQGSGQVILAQGTAPITATGTSMHTVANVVDFVGYGTATSSETAPTGTALTTTTSAQRVNGTDHDNNSSDFAAPGAPSPQNLGSGQGEPDTVTATNPGAKTVTTGTAITPITLQAAGGTPPYTWTATPLPAGLELNGASISGTPTTAGPVTVTATVTDSSDPAQSDAVQFTITVQEPGQPTPIAEIQGTGKTSPKANQPATTQGVVTAVYPTGGFNGFYIQTPGPDLTPGASDAIFVYVGNNQALLSGLAIGDSVRVSGTVKEFASGGGTLTELDAVAGTVDKIADLGTVVPKTVIPGTDCALPGTDCPDQTALDAAREAVEGEIFKPSGDFTVTDVYDGSAYNPPNSPSNNHVGEIGLAANSDQPLIAPTEIIPAANTADVNARRAWNNAHRVILDDGSSTTYWNTSNTAAQTQPLPWVTKDHQVRVGAKVTFDKPFVLDWRFGWKLQATSQIVGAPTGHATFEQNRPAAPQAVGGDLKLATFNVLNYFTSLGRDFPNCQAYLDRDKNPIAVDKCTGIGPRGAWTPESFQRQQAKIVKAINKIDADIVSVEEIENSLVVDNHDRDEALAALVTALNAAAGTGTWDYVRSPADASTSTNKAYQDVIRTGFIYKPSAVEVVGEAEMLFGTTAFDNAREPFAAVFKPVGGTDGDRFAVIVNHFKSKGSGVDDGTGQGNANPDRVAQADRLAQFAQDFSTERGVEAVFLTGDLNSYSQESPMLRLYAAGYSQVKAPNKHSYSFDGQSGSLDHVLANAAAKAMVQGSDIWEINANETVFNQYSRFNYVGTDLYSDGPYSASDHNPEIVGIKKAAAAATTDVQILGTNDFHGRLLPTASNREAGAAVLSGAVKQLREENPNTVFAAAGDLVGASTFESFIQHDKPTIDALNEAGLDVSAVGNHELDQGYDDLINRIMKPYDATDNKYGGAQWQYIAANLKVKTTGKPEVPATWIKTVDGVKVGFVGAVTEDLPTLVSPGGITDLKVEKIVESVNAEAADLRDQGADVVVMLVHEGSSTTDCTKPQFTDPTTTWGNITQNVSADVDAIVSGHTHLAYNCSFPVQKWIDEGRAVTKRPVVSAGQYAMNLDQLVFTVEKATGKVVGLKSDILPLMTPDPDGSGPLLPTALYPADPAVQAIVDEAKKQADTLGAQVLGKIAAPFNRAKLAGGTTENRGGESTLGNQVAEVQRWATEKPESGSAQIAFMNPGGLRDDMAGTVNGASRDVTYKQAAVVQPFANTLVNMKLTGAQIKKVLEQQWQRDGSGKVPSRPFLRLGVSKGFTYTYTEKPVTVQGVNTFEGTVTGMWLNGTPIDLGATYSVTVNQFLSTGGDNFFELDKGASKVDTGKVDLQAMVDYLAANASSTPLPVDYSQRAVGVTFPADAPASYKSGDHVVFDVSSWTMSTAADRKDEQIQVKIGDQQIGTATLDNTIGTDVFDQYGKAGVDVVLPGGLPAGPVTLTLVGAETGTEVRVPITVAATAPVKLAVKLTIKTKPKRVVVNKTKAKVVVLVVDAAGKRVNGTVRIKVKGQKAKTVKVTNGRAVLKLKKFTSKGTKKVVVTYAGSSTLKPAKATSKIKVVRRR